MDGSIRVTGHSDPALEGTTISLECSSPHLMLTGPNMTTCMGNREWEPDPRGTTCLGKRAREPGPDLSSLFVIPLHCHGYPADCGEVPPVDSSLNLTYNSTLEGSVVVVPCDGFVVRAVCHRNGRWSPQITDSVCNLTMSTPMATGISDNYKPSLPSI